MLLSGTGELQEWVMKKLMCNVTDMTASVCNEEVGMYL